MKSEVQNPKSECSGWRWHAAVLAVGLGMGMPTAGESLAVARLSPPDGAATICADTRLRIHFTAPVRTGANGCVRVMRVRDGAEAARLDVADPQPTNRYGTKTLRYEPFRTDGHGVTVELPTGALEPETEYSVVIDPGVFQSAAGQPWPGFTNGQWRFTTRAALARGRTRIEVAPDSQGDFCTLQGAVDYLPEDNYTPVEIFLRNGTYDGITYIGPGRNRLRIVGEDRKQTVLAGRNNDRLNPGRMQRPLLSVDSHDITIENLTVRNTTPKGGSQAEALRLEGERCVIRKCDFFSFQDTLLLNGRVYVADCYVEGDVDFIWGHGTTVFENCELKAVNDGYYVTSRNPADRFGFVFLNCRLSATPNVKRCWLARIGTDRFPDSAVAFIGCQMGPHIPAAGWLITGNDTARLRFWEHGTTDLEGRPLDVGQRHPASRQLTDAEAARWRDANRVLAPREDWRPKP